jgi:FAD/FMN-containing dehydrogenase
MKLTAWGNYPILDANIEYFSSITELQNILKSGEKLIIYGNGRSYGDQALGKHVVISKKYNYITQFDTQKGVITCQCGVTLEEILDVIVPKGWFLPVTPGTKYITVGGAVASDVHGKNHHKEGTFCDHVLSIDVMLPSGSIVTCSKKKNQELFKATCGGNGLTGVIINVTFSLKKIETAYITQRTIKAKNIEQLLHAIEKNEHYTYAVAWIDCVAKGKNLGRGVLLLGEHALVDDLPTNKQKSPLRLKNKPKLAVPFMFPNFVLNGLSIKIFNWLYYHKAKNGVHDSIIDYNSFFYPLDSIDNWNRIYGRRGFTQYQFVVPKKVGLEGISAIIKKISHYGKGSFLAVLKTAGPYNGNYLSFPMEGYTLALDFPISKGLFPFLDELDEVILQYGGRLYTTKDVRMKEAFFKASYPDMNKFIKVRKNIKANATFESLQSKRLGL